MQKIHDLFHLLANKHNFISIVSGVTRETLEDFLKEPISDDKKNKLSLLIENLKKIENGIQDAHKVVLEIKENVYNIIDKK